MKSKVIGMGLGVFCLTLALTLHLIRVPLSRTERAENERSQPVSSVGGAAAKGIGTTGLPVILIDPGHGGIDGGAVSEDGHIERDINLRIAKCLMEEISPYKAEVVMTRYDERGLYVDDGRTIRQKKREDLENRKAMMESPDVLFSISIHLNSFKENEKIYGVQVFYPKTQKGRTSVQNDKSLSQRVGEAVEKSMRRNITDWKIRATAPKDDALILKDTTADMILVECGFMSNKNDMERLDSVEYQRILSKAIWEGVNEILCLERKEKMKVIDNANRT